MSPLSQRVNQLRVEERGSVMVAVIVVMVISFAVVATVATVYSGLNLARTDQNRINAFQFANAGVDQALYRLDAQNLPAVNAGGYVPTVDVDGNVTGFTDSITEGGSNFNVEAVQDPAGQDTVWKVKSTGRDASGRLRLAIATVSATPIFVNGFFTHRLFDVRGIQRSPIAYDSNVCPTADIACEINPVPSRLGTNDRIEMSNSTYVEFVDRWLGFNMYGRATQQAADIACGTEQLRCGTYPEVIQITDRYETPYPPCLDGVPHFSDGTCGEPAPSQPCPAGGNIGTDGITTTIQPGDYVCNDLNLSGNIVVGTMGNGTGQVRFWVRDNFSVADGSVVNQFKPPAKFQVFQEESTTNSGIICGAQIWALLYTPGLTINCPGSSQPHFWGAVVASFHRGPGSHFEFHYDVDTLNTVHDGKYVVRNWRECPPGAADC